LLRDGCRVLPLGVADLGSLASDCFLLVSSSTNNVGIPPSGSLNSSEPHAPLEVEDKTMVIEDPSLAAIFKRS